MYQATQVEQTMSAVMGVHHQTLTLETLDGLQFIDITDSIKDIVASAGIEYGWINIQTKHTTTAIIINEHEPLLLEDMKDLFERIAPQAHDYRHNDFEVRTVNMQPDESPNGHSHCRSLFLRASETINIVGGEMQLGRWQRIFFLELDCPRQRNVSVMVMGQSNTRLRIARNGKA